MLKSPQTTDGMPSIGSRLVVLPEGVVVGSCLLQGHDVGRLLAEPAQECVPPRIEALDVPGCDSHGGETVEQRRVKSCRSSMRQLGFAEKSAAGGLEARPARRGAPRCRSGDRRSKPLCHASGWRHDPRGAERSHTFLVSRCYSDQLYATPENGWHLGRHILNRPAAPSLIGKRQESGAPSSDVGGSVRHREPDRGEQRRERTALSDRCPARRHRDELAFLDDHRLSADRKAERRRPGSPCRRESRAKRETGPNPASDAGLRGHLRGHGWSSGSQPPLPLRLPLPRGRQRGSREPLAPLRLVACRRIRSPPLGRRAGLGATPLRSTDLRFRDARSC